MTIQRQIELLNKIVGVMHASAGAGYSGMECEFDHETYEGGWSVGSNYCYIMGANRISGRLDDPEDTLSDFVHELHELMKVHTGGDWTSFLLTVDAGGKAATKFYY
ncbi:hypothetical protein ABB27_05450 [Stenotrophomonas terrae]|uniref:Uncharacterized protein n=1 Tax=Stenotrophomonas terrae TaxID=405446 RepID=A0A0R0CWK2_9GAMM|nr:hypothetical protein [Stenotrophomonas terrae]KRG69715.1 hypothetical protein ABB27_05450 [Stenotrophomonas terrae]